MNGASSIPVPSVIEPNQDITFRVNLIAPNTAGDYTGVWQLFADDGEEMGRYWVKIIYRILQKSHRKKRFYFIFGNHDIEYRNPDIVERKLNWVYNRNTDEEEILFENFKVHEALVFKHKESGVKLFTVHGHQGDDLFHRFIWLNRVLLRTLWRPLQLMGFQDPSSIAQNTNKRQKVEEQLIKWAVDHKQPMICGHTHKERFPKKGKPPYFNNGSSVHPRWITCIEIKEGKIALIRWRIKPNKKRQLVVKRTVLKGPKRIENFVISKNSVD